MRLMPDPVRRQAPIEKAMACLFLLFILITDGAAGERIALPTMQDALNLIEADRVEFFDIVGADEEGLLPQDQPRKLLKIPSTGIHKNALNHEADPALEDFAALGVLIESEPEAPDNVELHVSRAELFAERGFHDRAIQDLLMALRLDMGSQAAWHALGRAHEMKGELKMAQAAYADAIALGEETEAGIAAQWDQQVLKLIPADNRRETIEALGMPDAFTLIMAAKSPGSNEITRHETWFYYRAGLRFEFVNGIVVSSDELEDVNPETVEAIYTPYRPHQFLSGLDIDAVADITGEKEYVLYELGDGPLQDGELVYTRQLALGFKNGSLIYVRTFPLFTDE